MRKKKSQVSVKGDDDNDGDIGGDRGDTDDNGESNDNDNEDEGEDEETVAPSFSHMVAHIKKEKSKQQMFYATRFQSSGNGGRTSPGSPGALRATHRPMKMVSTISGSSNTAESQLENISKMLVHGSTKDDEIRAGAKKRNSVARRKTVAKG